MRTMARLYSLLLLLIVAAAMGASAHHHSKDQPKRVSLVLTTGDIEQDGVTKPDSVLVNGTSPGPPLRFVAGDTVLINVTNAMTDKNATIHWHGLSQRMTPASDGTPLISQWPIAPGRWFEYEMKLTKEDITPTVISYHSHVGLQIQTAQGPFIVEDPHSPLEYDDERIVMFNDYHHESQSNIEKGLLADTFVWPGTANALLINGLAYNATSGPATIDVDYDQTYLLRYIGGQSLMYTTIAILNHTQKLVEADGTYLKPYRLNAIEIASGQRYSTLIKTKSKEEVDEDRINGCYWVRMESQWRSPAINGWALLRYPGCQNDVDQKQLQPPQTNNSIAILPKGQFGWLSSQFEPLPGYRHGYIYPSDDEVTRRVIIDTRQVLYGPIKKGNRWQEDNYIYSEEDTTQVPYLIELYKNTKDRPSYQRALNPPPGVDVGYDNVTQTWVANPGEVIDIVLVNRPSQGGHNVETHPFHFHSAKHWHVASGMGNFTDAALSQAREGGNYSNPIARDTTNVWPGPGASITNQTLPDDGAGGWSLLRYRVREHESGAWPLHCHWAFHLIMGMSTTWVLGPDELDTKLDYLGDSSYFYFNQNVPSPYTKAHGGTS